MANTESSGTQRRLFAAVIVALAIGVSFVVYRYANRHQSTRELRLWSQARESLQLGRTEMAARQLDELLKLNPQQEEALLLRANLLRDQGDDRAALALLRRIPADPGTNRAIARLFEGSIAAKQRRAGEAERCFRESIRLDPQYVPARERLLELYVMQSRRDEALRALTSLAEVRPLSLADQALTITAGERLLPPKEAIGMFQQFVDADSQDVMSLRSLGLYLRDDQQSEQAIAVLRKALFLRPGDPASTVALAQILIEHQDLEAAIEVLPKVKTAIELSADVCATYGLWFVAAGDSASALTCFAEAAHRDRLHRLAFTQLGLALGRAGHSAEATIVLHHAAKLDRLREALAVLGTQRDASPKRGELISRVAQLLHELGEARRAVPWERHARELDPGFAAPEPNADAVAAIDSVLKRFHGDLPVIPTMKSRAIDRAASGSTPEFRFRDDAERLGLKFRYFNGATGLKFLLESMGGGLGALDFDGDGWVDFYFPQGRALPLNDVPPPLDKLFRNVQGEHFEEIPDWAGVGDPHYGLGAAVGDFDNDGFDDLLVGHFGRNTLLHNQGDGTFRDITEAAGIVEESMSSSVGLADFDHDGDLDLFVVNYVEALMMCHNARGEVSTCNPSNHLGASDRVYRNQGDGQFEDVTREFELTPDGKGLGLLLADLDDDGWTDAVVANDTTPNFLYFNRPGDAAGKRRFDEAGLPAGIALSEAGVAQGGMGIACGDLNDDLKLDLYVTYFYREANGLYVNESHGLFREATRAAGLFQPTFNLLGFGTQTLDVNLDGRLELFVANGHIDDLRSQEIPWKMRPQLFWRTDAGIYLEAALRTGDYFRGEYLGRGVARCDWNHDRRPDLVIVHQDRPVALLTNDSPEVGSSLKLRLRGVTSNRSAVGAKILVTGNGRTQRADVLGADGYLCSNDRDLVFGLGNSATAAIEIQWPSGHIDRLADLRTSTTWIVREGMPPVSWLSDR